MKLVTKVSVLATVVFLAACGANSSAIEALNKAEAVGSPFTKKLTEEYRHFSNGTQEDSMQFSDSVHFARKGLASASGVIVMPETLADWSLSEQNLVEMTTARNDLVDVLEGGGRELAPEKAALAQIAFDCWAQQQEKNWNKDVSCKIKFYDALKDLRDTLGAAPKPVAVADKAPVEEFPAPVTETTKTEQTAPQQAMFIVFFDWNKSTLSAGANDILDAVANELKNRKDVKGITVVGHTDTSGSAAYNQKLSLKRAKAVRAGLVARGVDAKLVKAEGHGEDDLLVKTPDGTREPSNRRTQITLE